MRARLWLTLGCLASQGMHALYRAMSDSYSTISMRLFFFIFTCVFDVSWIQIEALSNYDS